MNSYNVNRRILCSYVNSCIYIRQMAVLVLDAEEIRRSPFTVKNTVTCATLLAILLLSAWCVLSCSQRGETGQTSVQLINRAYEQEAIDYDTRALYLTYSIYEPEALPPEYQSNVPIKSATPIILEIQRNWDRLSPATQEEISQYIQPLEKRDSA